MENNDTPETLMARAVIKLSSSLNNLDALEGKEHKHFKGKFLKDINKFLNFFSLHSKPMVDEFYKEDSESFYFLVYDVGEELDNLVLDPDHEIKQVSLILSKLDSALQDLKASRKDTMSKLFVDPLINRIRPILHQRYVKRFPVLNSKIKEVSTMYTEEYEKRLVA